ncbi:DUF1643 domain-containing protein [Ferroacidibacillus organovorans]|uniref:DUF1643 domain-containing protein n=1 Tax=Ferroacidibacillus organovorans TaxID=1765683 RepID=A0A1V4EVN4_9BACL|nr:DUF1643 domain-containing protein [Ferroacidibacillus organovorans]OPG16961.1 hypothetical protein B2M26_03900 [Ferroacidibacillus organovorans]
MRLQHECDTCEVIHSDAIFDLDHRYRYSLTRCWDSKGSRMVFLMLNPSTADAHQNDPTITRCMNFSRRWGFGSLEVVNLFAYRSTDPGMLSVVDDPIGPENDAYILNAITRSELVVLAWGTKGVLRQRDQEVLNLISDHELYALEISKYGHPKHPLYLRSEVWPTRFRMDDSTLVFR